MRFNQIGLRCVVACAGLFVGFHSAIVSADTISFGAANSFAILGLEGGNVTINSATSITGNVGFSSNVTVGEAQKVDTFVGTTYVASGTTTTGFNAKHDGSLGPVQYGNGSPGNGVDPLLHQANLDALAAASAFTAMGTGTNLGALGDNDSQILTAGVYTISSLDYKEDFLRLVGDANSSFVFNVTGSFDWDNSSVELVGGVLANNVVFNFTNTSPVNINIDKSGTVFNGTILAPSSTAFVEYHNPATFNGRIIASNIDVHSDFNITVPPTTAVPVPPAFAAGAVLMGGLGSFRLLRRRHATAA